MTGRLAALLLRGYLDPLPASCLAFPGGKPRPKPGPYQGDREPTSGEIPTPQPAGVA